jgi:hypothetical protein
MTTNPVHHPDCPVMDSESCHTVGGVDPMHDRFTFGKCRCGKPCYCDRLFRVEKRYHTVTKQA